MSGLVDLERLVQSTRSRVADTVDAARGEQAAELDAVELADLYHRLLEADRDLGLALDVVQTAMRRLAQRAVAS